MINKNNTNKNSLAGLYKFSNLILYRISNHIMQWYAYTHSDKYAVQLDWLLEMWNRFLDLHKNEIMIDDV